MLQSEKERQIIENDIEIAEFQQDPEARGKELKNKLEIYKKEKDLELEREKVLIQAEFKQKLQLEKQQFKAVQDPRALVQHLRESNLKMKEQI
jgi:hypothetical protein